LNKKNENDKKKKTNELKKKNENDKKKKRSD
jgi:hypothetical protein